MNYLICDTCESYYELQPGESPDDFTDKCECGGNLHYCDSLNKDYITHNKSNKNKKPVDIIDLIITAVMFLVAVGTSGVCLFYINLTLQVSKISFSFIGIPFIVLMGFVWLMFTKSVYSLVKE